jgi:hypothetical protein
MTQAFELPPLPRGLWWTGLSDAEMRTVVEIMRTADAYAFDYATDGKMADTRRELEREIAAAIRAMKAG